MICVAGIDFSIASRRFGRRFNKPILIKELITKQFAQV
jgi:hypothetical protein